MKFINYLRHGVPYDRREMFITKGHPNRPGGLLDNNQLKAVVVHYTANDAVGADAIMNAKYFNRAWRKNGAGEACEITKEGQPEIEFRYGSTHLICDMERVVVTLPYRRGYAEPAWQAGDRPLPYTDLDKGQKPLARKVFNFRQNFQCVGVEICNNDVIPNSDRDWDTSVSVAIDFIRRWLIEDKYWVELNPEASSSPVQRAGKDRIFLLRHGDLTGKMCPLPLIDNPADWQELCQLIAEPVNFQYDRGRVGAR